MARIRAAEGSGRNASVLLGLINVTQPVSYENLVEAMGDDVEGELLNALRFLVARRLVKQLPGHQYRTTWAGQRAVGPKLISKKRDVDRMWYLSQLSDSCRKNEGGEAS